MKRILIIAAVLLISILLSASIIFSYPTHSGTYSISSLETKILEWFVDYPDRADRAKNGPEQIKVHPWLTLRAIELFEKTYNVTLSDLERQEIIAGSIEEDYDIEGTSDVEKWSNLDILKSLSEKELDYNYYTQSERCMNHFMDESGIGLARMSSAKKWALDDENNSTRYTEALRLAKAGDKKGWRYLGHVLHLLQDMSVPAHVRMDPHPFNDTYERELAGKDIKGYHKLVGEELGTPAYKADKEVLFTNLAKYARDHYISDNSFGKYGTPLLSECKDEKYKNYKCNSTDTLVGAVAYKGVLHALTKEAFTLKINDKVAESMFQDLGLASIRSGARLVELFYHEVIGYKISGRVTYNGIGLAGVGITRTRDGKSAWVGKTDADGWYTFESPNGTYTITPSLAYYSFNPTSVSITVNNENFDVQDFTATAVSTGYTISGQVTYNGTGLAGVTVTLAGTGSSAVTAANGVYTLTNVANGTYTMSFSASGYSFNPSTKSITVNGENVLIVNNIIATAASSGGIWTQKADFGGTARVLAVGFSIGTKGYIGTGLSGFSAVDFWEYDSSTNLWTQKADFGGAARYAAVGFSIGSKGYIGTGSKQEPGFDLIKDFWEYDSSTNLWTQKADFGGAARYTAVGFSIGNKGYIGTGFYDVLKKDFWEYDPSTNLWTQKADFGGAARNRAVGFSIGTKGYIGTGNATNDFWEYDPSTNLWTQKADFGGEARNDAVGFSIGNKGYIGTGSSHNSVYYKDFWEYDPGTNVWTQKADFGGSARGYAVGFLIGSKGYIGTGYDVTTGVDFWEYVPGQ